MEFLLAPRFVLGLAVGTASFVSVEYISEQAPKRLRGGVTSFNQVMMTFGILISYRQPPASRTSTRPGAGCSVSRPSPVALAIEMLTIPESPRWLVANRRVEEARAALGRTRSDDDVEEEVREITETTERESRNGLRDLFRKPRSRLMIVGLILAAGQQLIGVNTVIYYSATILRRTGLSAIDSVLQAVSVGITNVIFTVIAVLLLDRVGRRPLLLVGTAAVVVALVGLGLWFQLHFWQQHGCLALGVLLLFMAGFAIGFDPVFWLMISEIYPLAIRSKAMGVATVTNLAANFLVSYFFPQLVVRSADQRRSASVQASVCCRSGFFLWRLPETRNRSLEGTERELGVPTGGAANGTGDE